MEPIPPAGPTVLKIDFTFSGASLATNTPLVLQIYNNKGDMTNQTNPLYIYNLSETNGNVAITNIPAGTYYFLVFYDDSPRDGSMNTCSENFMIYTNFNWWFGQAIDATPISIMDGVTTTINVNFHYNQFYTWAPNGC